MKRIVTVLLFVCCMFAFAACDKGVLRVVGGAVFFTASGGRLPTSFGRRDTLAEFAHEFVYAPKLQRNVAV